MGEDRSDFLSDQRIEAERAGRDLTAPVDVTHFFSSPGMHPQGVVDALGDMNITNSVTDEEISGDGYWHVAAFTRLKLGATESGRPNVTCNRSQWTPVPAMTAGCSPDRW